MKSEPPQAFVPSRARQPGQSPEFRGCRANNRGFGGYYPPLAHTWFERWPGGRIMSFGGTMSVLWILAAALAGLVVGRTSERDREGATLRAEAVAFALGAIGLALITVGLLSNTVSRHSLQVAPVAMALIVVRFHPRAGVVAAAPLFAFWLLVMGGIWLFLLGVARVFTGSFSLAEVALTIVIGGASAAGLVAAFQPSTSWPRAARWVTVVALAGLQAAAVWLSYQPFVLGR